MSLDCHNNKCRRNCRHERQGKCQGQEKNDYTLRRYQMTIFDGLLSVEEHVGLHGVDRRRSHGRRRHHHDIKCIVVVVVNVLLPQRWPVCPHSRTPLKHLCMEVIEEGPCTPLKEKFVKFFSPTRRMSKQLGFEVKQSPSAQPERMETLHS